MKEISLIKHAKGALGLRVFGLGPNLKPTNGLIKEHRDYFDFCGPTFGPVPILGPFIRWLYSKFVS